MASGPSRLGEVEQLVLLAVLRLDGRAYAVPVRSLIQRDAGVTLFRGAVYVTLERLERKGYLDSRFTEPTATRGGKARRVFSVRPEGMAALRASRRVVDRLAAGTVLARAGIKR